MKVVFIEKCYSFLKMLIRDLIGDEGILVTVGIWLNAPNMHFGLPLHRNPKTLSFWQPVLEKVEEKTSKVEAHIHI